MSTRFWIGIVQMFVQPGICTARSSSPPNPTSSSRSFRQRTSRRANRARQLLLDRRRAAGCGGEVGGHAAGAPSRGGPRPVGDGGGRALAVAPDSRPGPRRPRVDGRRRGPARSSIASRVKTGGAPVDQLGVERPDVASPEAELARASRPSCEAGPSSGAALAEELARCAGRHTRASGRRTAAGPRPTQAAISAVAIRRPGATRPAPTRASSTAAGLAAGVGARSAPGGARIRAGGS